MRMAVFSVEFHESDMYLHRDSRNFGNQDVSNGPLAHPLARVHRFAHSIARSLESLAPKIVGQ